YLRHVGRKNIRVPGEFGRSGQQRQMLAVFNRPNNDVVNKRTNQPAVDKPLDGQPPRLDAGEDPRPRLADWMTDAKNPFFARAVVNRYWAHFFGRGIVDPLDDMRVTNPPTNP